MVVVDSNQSNPFEIIRQSVDELQQKQNEIHRQIGQLSCVMNDFEYHMSRIRDTCQTMDEPTNQKLCQSLLTHLTDVIFDTRSALVASTASNHDVDQVQDLVRRLYDENERMAHHIDYLLEQNPPDEIEEEDQVAKAIEQIELALEQNLREQERLRREEEQYEKNEQIIETFLNKTDRLHDEALKKLREHIHQLREQNQSLKQYNEQIDRLTEQLPQTLVFSSK